MTGLAWFVALVAYPLFGRVGRADWPAYHALHSARTSLVVLPPMAVQLGASLALVAEPPGGVGRAAAAAGAGLALATWALTAAAARVHGAFGGPGDPAGRRRLARLHALRTAAWTAHAGLLLAFLAVADG